MKNYSLNDQHYYKGIKICHKGIKICQFCTCLKEHQRAVSNSNSSKSALPEHVSETSHNIVWDDSTCRIITTHNRYGKRLCLEAWHINASSCALNRDD